MANLTIMRLVVIGQSNDLLIIAQRSLEIVLLVQIDAHMDVGIRKGRVNLRCACEVWHGFLRSASSAERLAEIVLRDEIALGDIRCVRPEPHVITPESKLAM